MVSPLLVAERFNPVLQWPLSVSPLQDRLYSVVCTCLNSSQELVQVQRCALYWPRVTAISVLPR